MYEEVSGVGTGGGAFWGGGVYLPRVTCRRTVFYRIRVCIYIAVVESMACAMPWGVNAHSLTGVLQHTRAMCVCADDTIVLAAGYAPQFSLHRVQLERTGATILRHLAGHGQGFQDGHGSAAMFNVPIDLAADVDNTVLVADYFNHAIRRIDVATTVVTTFCTNLDYPQNVCLCPDGTVLVLDQRGVFRYQANGQFCDVVCDSFRDVSTMIAMPKFQALLCSAHGNAFKTIDCKNQIQAWPTEVDCFVEDAAVDVHGNVFVVTRPMDAHGFELGSKIEMYKPGAKEGVVVDFDTSNEPRCIALTNDGRVLVAGVAGLFTIDYPAARRPHNGYVFVSPCRPRRVAGFFPRWTNVWCKPGSAARSTMSPAAINAMRVVLLVHTRAHRRRTPWGVPVLPVELWFAIFGFIGVAEFGVFQPDYDKEDCRRLAIERRESARLRALLYGE